MRLTKKGPHRTSRLKDMTDNYTNHMNGNAVDIRVQGILDPGVTRNKRFTLMKKIQVGLPEEGI